MTSQAWGLLGVGVGIMGTLATTVVNNFLGRSSQRTQWIRDKKMQEYRELLSAMSKAEMLLIRLKGFTDGNDIEMREQAEIETWTTIKDRIFIANVMMEEEVRWNWGRIVRKYHDDADVIELVDECGKLRTR